MGIVILDLVDQQRAGDQRDQMELTVRSVGEIEVQRIDGDRTQHEEVQVGPQKVQAVLGYEDAPFQFFLLAAYPFRQATVYDLS